MSPEEVTNALELHKLKDRLWYVVPSVATEGTGIFEGLVRILLVRSIIISIWADSWIRHGCRIT